MNSEEISATPFDNPHLILLFYLTQLFLRELVRSYHLLKIIPMDMNGYFGKCEFYAHKEEESPFIIHTKVNRTFASYYTFFWERKSYRCCFSYIFPFYFFQMSTQKMT
jgi:hypothetical protein